MPSHPLDPRLESAQCHDLQPVELMHSNPWFNVMNRGGRYTVEYQQPQVAILPVVARTSVVMVQVKRPVSCEETLELPAGAIEVGESTLEGGRRELAEEAGIHIADLSRFRPLFPHSVTPNRSPVLVHILRVDLTEEEFNNRQPHDEEIARVVRLDDKTIERYLLTGEIYVSLFAAVLATQFLLPLISRRMDAADSAKDTHD